MKKITVLLLHMQHGGIERQTISLVNELCKRYSVTIISTYSMNKEPAYPVDSSVSVKCLINDRPSATEFKTALKKGSVCGIIKYGLKAFKILLLKYRLMKKEIKKLDCDYVLSTRIEFAYLLSRYAPANVVKVTQEHLHDDSMKYIKRVKSSFFNIDYLIVLSEDSVKNYSLWLRDNKKIRILKIPNIIESRTEDKAALDSNRIVSVGRLHPVKDFSTLIEVFRRVRVKIPDATLTIVGGGEEKKKLESLASAYGLSDCVTVTGMVQKEEVQKYMLDSDIYVMTSLTECFPMVLLEASSVGLPLVSFDVPVGPKAIIENDVNGYLIKDRELDSMAEKVVELLSDREKLRTLGEKSKEMANNFLPENVMPLWFDLFK